MRRFTRRTRRRRTGALVVIGILGMVAALIAVAVFSPILALREIRVDGTTRLDPALVRDAVAGQLGTPLALLDEGRIRSELSQFTTIRSYVTELVPPDTLVIHIVERSPLGVVVSASGFDVVDAAGVVLESSPSRPDDLPLLQTDAEGAEGAAFAAMAEVLVALPGDVLAQVDSISARTRDDVTLTLTGSDQRVVWGSAADSDRKAAVLAALLERFAGAGGGEYDVSAPGSAVFRRD
jgi:cell division protein FtsQ